MTTISRFGVLVLQDAPFPTLAERWRRVEELGFDQLFVADHTGDYRDTPGGFWFDGWTVLAAMAAHTTNIRIGTLVSNPVLRPPAVLAKAAVTVDHLSDGRLELGIGTGIAPFDHAATGTESWSAGERSGRFAEYVEVVDGLLRGAGRPYSFDGRWYRSREASTVPGPLQRPRPPIIVAGQSPTVLRVAAARADAWNTHGPFGAGLDEIVKITRSQTRQLDELCAAAGRDPASLRRSLFLFAALDPWTSDVEPAAVIERFAEQARIAEFVVSWPGDDRVGDLERLANVIRR
jgi:alkanesulfonate monooxygenase SsuD/methylene tetrahydromethanopterin reductase-like flavin-dependent oxidoreductase (luciferase family)